MVNTTGELTRLNAGTMHAEEMLQASQRIMAVAEGSHWSQAAAYRGWALYAQGHVADALALIEEAWQRAEALDDPIAGGLAAGLGGACCATLYDFSRAEQWYTREMVRPRARLSAAVRFELTHLLASARISQGDVAGARELLTEFEGAASNHYLLAFFEGDWERAVALRRRELDAARAHGQRQTIADCASILGRFARLGNLRREAEEYLDEGLTASIASPSLNREIFIRVERAVFNADLARIDEANEDLRRCREILDGGEDWRGHRGAFACASALVEAAEPIAKAKRSEPLWAMPAARMKPVKLPDRVTEGFGAAIEIFRRYHSPWDEAMVLALWSRVLLASGHHRQSVEKFNWAFAIFDSLEAPAQLTDRVHAEMFRFMALTTRPAATTPSLILGSNLFRKEGEYWTISFEGSVFRLRDTMGMHYISRLLANPGVDFSAHDLTAVAHRHNLRRARGKKPSASMRNGRVSERRENHADADRERARLMVTKRIKDVIAKIRLTHPELARHFASSIRTGYTCAYLADEDQPTTWAT
jgi:hypothetical protein